MFKGVNTLHLNGATVCEALQEYLNRRITAADDQLVVTRVTKSGDTFEVSVEQAKEKK